MEKKYLEAIISVKISKSEIFARIFSIVGSALLTILSIPLIGMYFMVVAFIAGYLLYLLFFYTTLEYEYQLIKDTLNVDKIYGKDKRKAGSIFEINKIELLAPMNSEKLDRYLNQGMQMMTFDYTSRYDSDTVYVMIIRHGASTAKVFLNLNNEFLEAIKKQVPTKVFM